MGEIFDILFINMPTLYLIDGNSYFYRAFYAIRSLSTSKGFPTNAIYGFTNMILKILREKEPDYFSVVFDSPGPTERHKVYEDYKAHRPSMPDDLRSQIPMIKEVIDAFNIHMVEMEGYEADDLLGTIAKFAEKDGVDVYIVTGDKDLCQVISPRIKLFDSMKDKTTEEDDVIKRFGVEPARLPEVMALMGDKSDNIPGVPGIGEKTAVKLIKEFGSLENLIKNSSQLKNPKIRNSITENIDKIKLSLLLATIDTDAPLDISINELKPGKPDWTELFNYFREFEFHSMLKLVPEHETLPADSTEYITVLDKDVLDTALGSIKDEVTIDTETTSKSPMEAELVGISFSADPDKAYYVPLAHSYGDVPPQLSKKHVLKRFRTVLENKSISKTGHNIKYDLIVLKNEKINLEGIKFDTILASYLLNPNRTNHSLEDVSMQYLAYKKLSFSDVVSKGRKDFREVPIQEAARYSGEDSAVTMKLKKHFEPKIKKEGLSGLFYDLELPLINVLADMEMTGIKIDISLMKSLSGKLEDELSGLEKRIYFYAGEEFNINSPKQLQEILFEKIGLKPLKKTKTGYSTDVEVLEQLAFDHELPGEILEYRALSKLKNTYVDALPKIVNPKTGRIHTSFNQTVTATGRLSSSDPNLQNIPVRGEWGQRIRGAFTAKDGHLLLSADYSQIELRILAHLSRDKGLLEVFKSDGDIHSRTASELFGVSIDNATTEMRRRAKTVNFGIVYGMSPYGLSKELGIPPKEAKHYIDTYFSRHNGVKKYFDTLIEKATEKGCVTTLLKRKRDIPELKSVNKNIRQLGERLAMNTPIQGSAADIIKISMLNIWKRLKIEKLRTKMLLQVHDELLFELPSMEKNAVKELVKEEMEKAIELLVPLKVEIGIGKNWSEAH
jgi:DNA polymerase-1